MTRYGAEFMASIEPAAHVNVAALVPILTDELGAVPASVVDVGCGPGAWVREFAALGCDAVGIDGRWAQPNLVVPSDRFVARDLAQPLSMDRRFDLAVSIEVAEHLPPERGDGFVADLCGLADSVLFSAALPGQAGTGHINLRWQSYWHSQFESNGYGVIDCVRPALWNVKDVSWPLAQQCFLFRRGVPSRLAMPADVVHPGMHHELTYPPRLRKLVGELPGAVSRFVGHHRRRFR